MFNETDVIGNDRLDEIQKELHEMNRILRVIARITPDDEYWRETFARYEARQTRPKPKQ